MKTIPIMTILLTAAFYLLITAPVMPSSQTDGIKVGIDEKLGQHIPLDLKFANDKGDTVSLGSVLKKPAIFALVYYHCRSVCSPMLIGLSDVADEIQLKPNEEFQIITISFDHHENYHDAAQWKKEHMNAMKAGFPEAAWTFMTGDSVSIQKLTRAAGFYFKPEKQDFAHPAALIILSEKGMISRYIFGIKFLPFDLKMALVEARQGRSSPTINKILDYCFSYDRQKNSYVFNVTKVAATVILLSAVIFLAVLTLKNRTSGKRI